MLFLRPAASLRGYRLLAFIFWVLAIAAIAIWSQVPSYHVGWDRDVYVAAIESLRRGHDPYADGIAIQRAFHALPVHTAAAVPFTYVYSPMTLPLVRAIGRLPFAVSGSVYWTLYILFSAAAIWVGMQFVQPDEKKVFALLAPVAIFFPGLLQNDVLFSGNVAYLLHGMVLLAAWVGWSRNRWAYFYIAVLLASCCKAPLLSLLAIPLLSARRQWIPAGIAGALGLGLFAMQRRVWPQLFADYLTAVELQFSFNRDFSSSPAGLLANALYNVIPYRITSIGFYLFYALPFFAVLLVLRKPFFERRITREQWVPLMLIGVLLMNPRIMEYDIAPLTIPMALVAWRLCKRLRTTLQAIIVMAGSFAILQVFALMDWRTTACLLLCALFFGGCYDLFDRASKSPAPMAEAGRTSFQPEAVSAR